MDLIEIALAKKYGGGGGQAYIAQDEAPSDTSAIWIDTDDNSGDDYQPKTITDTAGYFTTDTVEGALQEIGAELSGINTLIGSGVIV